MGFIELNSGTRKQMKEEQACYETEKQNRSDGNEETVDKVLRDFKFGQNNNNRNNVDAGYRGKGIQNAEVSEGESESNRTANSQSVDGNISYS